MVNGEVLVQDVLDNYQVAKQAICRFSRSAIASLKVGMESSAELFLIQNQTIVNALRKGEMPKGSEAQKQKYLDVLLVAQALLRFQQDVSAESGDFAGVAVSSAKSLLDASGKLKVSVLPVFSEFTVCTAGSPLIARHLVNGVLKKTRRNVKQPENRIKNGGKILIDLVHTPALMKGTVQNSDGTESTHLFVRVRNVNGKYIGKKGYYVSMTYLEASFDTVAYDKMIVKACGGIDPTPTPKPKPKPKRREDIEVDDTLPDLVTVREQQKSTPEKINNNYENCFKWELKMLKRLQEDLSLYKIDVNRPQEDAYKKIARDYQQKMQNLNDGLYNIINNDSLSAKQKFEESFKLRDLIFELQSIYDAGWIMVEKKNFNNSVKTHSALRRIDLLLSVKMPPELMEAQMEGKDSDDNVRKGLRDVAVMHGFELDVIAEGAHRLDTKLQKLNKIHAKIQKEEPLTQSEKDKVTSSALFFHRDPLMNLISARGESYIERIKFLQQFVTPETAKVLDKQVKLITDMIRLKTCLKALISKKKGSPEYEALLVDVVPLLVGVAVTAAAVTLAPVTGGLSLAAAATFVSATAAGVAGNEVGNVLGDAIGKEIYGPLYQSRAEISKYFDGDLDGNALVAAYGKNFVNALVSDVITLGAGKFCKKGLNSFYKYLEKNESRLPKFLQVIKTDSATRVLGEVNDPLERVEGQYMVRFLENLQDEAKEAVFEEGMAQLYASVLTMVKPKFVEEQLGASVSNRIVSSSGPDHLKVSYQLSESDADFVRNKLSELGLNASFESTADSKVMTYNYQGKIFELEFILEENSQVLTKDLEALNVNFNRPVYDLVPPGTFFDSNSPSEMYDLRPYKYDGPKFEVLEDKGGHMYLRRLLTLKGYTLKPINEFRGFYDDYKITKEDPKVDTTIRLRYGKGEPKALIMPAPIN